VSESELNGRVARRKVVTRQGNLQRSTQWSGLRTGDAVLVNLERERRHKWVFVAHVKNTVSNEEWIEVRGGKSGDTKTRSFRCDAIFPAAAKKGAKIVGLSLQEAPQLPFD